MFCPHCAADLGGNVPYCPRCGKEVSRPLVRSHFWRAVISEGLAHNEEAAFDWWAEQAHSSYSVQYWDLTERLLAKTLRIAIGIKLPTDLTCKIEDHDVVVKVSSGTSNETARGFPYDGLRFEAYAEPEARLRLLESQLQGMVKGAKKALNRLETVGAMQP